jgi:hypothetical protein
LALACTNLSITGMIRIVIIMTIQKGIIMQMKLIFTTKGKVAIENFSNDELVEIFNRYSNTLSKKYVIDVSIPLELNQDIVGDGHLKVVVDNVKCDVDLFFRELGRDVKIPLKKRLDGKLDHVFKVEKVV